jgi:S1-C subfamily serine protease
VNIFDVLIVVLVGLAIIIGYGSGALPQIAGLIGAFGGGALALALVPRIEPLLEQIDTASIRATIILAGILLLVGLGEAVGSTIGRAVTLRLRGSPLGTVDRALGGLVGGAQALLVFWLVGGLLAAGPLRYLATQAQTSLIVRGLDSVLPAPTEIAAELGTLLDESGVPDLFVGLEPLPAPPVERPTDPAAEAIARRAEDSTVKVAALTCQFTSSGTGFAIDRDYVVTNAHVVAGARTIRVAIQGGGPLDAVPVYDDPELDIALLWVDGLNAAPLRLASADPARGAVGATIGFPRGGPLVVSAAAVAGSYVAQGRDIYGEHRVSRQILELRAAIDQGDSGGPLVLADGTIGGVVFAEARTDETVGYALTPTAVARAVEPSLGRTGPVETGSCIR